MKTSSLFPRQRHISKKIVAVWASICVVLYLFFPLDCHPTEIRWISGARLNDGQIHGVNGGQLCLSSKWSLFVGGDLGGDLGAASVRGMRHFNLGTKTVLSALIGANVEISEPPADPYTELIYLNSTSGFAFTYKLSPNTHLWLAIDYLYPFPNHRSLKIGAGFSLRLDL
jgi:hypothetical protein